MILRLFGGKNVEKEISVPFTTCCSRCLHGRLYRIQGADHGRKHRYLERIYRVATRHIDYEIQIVVRYIWTGNYRRYSNHSYRIASIDHSTNEKFEAHAGNPAATESVEREI